MIFNHLKYLRIFLIFISSILSADSFVYNSYNNHGVVGLINMPTARFFDEGVIGMTVYDGTPDQKITITSAPYDWLEASFFYTNFQGRPSGFPGEDFKDKGFNFKLRLKEEGRFPAIAIGINDIAGTGFYSGEYVIASYGIDNIDLHFGFGWGKLNGSKKNIKNPLIYIDDRFIDRPSDENSFAGKGGQFQPSRYFSDKTISPIYGVTYALNQKLKFKVEHDTTSTPGNIGYEIPNNRTSLALEYNINDAFLIGFSKERDNYYSLKLTYKQNANSKKRNYKYKKIENNTTDNKYTKFIKNLENNGIGVNTIKESSDAIGLEITQFIHPSMNVVNDIINNAKSDSGIKKEVKTDYSIADLKAYSNIDEDFDDNSTLIYKKSQKRGFNTANRINFRPFFAAREGFFKFGILAENDSEYIFTDNIFFSSNIKYSIYDNYDDLVVPPVDTYPEQVRSDVKDYMRNFDKPIIGRAQIDYHRTLKKNNHIMLTAGILEEMYQGFGFEYLNFDINKDYAVGIELFNVKKRDYDLRFGTLDYETTTGFINFYHRNFKYIPFDSKISYGKYLAGDKGITIELSRTFSSGAHFGVFATFTDVSTDQFGEGSFDKGLFFSIPIYKNLVNYTWRPLTKDPGAVLNRKHTLHNLLIKFKPFEK